MKKHAHRILLVDDDLEIRYLTEHALTKALPEGATIHAAGSGNEAIRYLIGEKEYADRTRFPFPTVIITDLSMPDGDGLALLEFLEVNPAWSIVPRIVFTSSDDDDDVRNAFRLRASAYHLKPTSLRETEACMRNIIDYWSTSAVPPVDPTGRLLITKTTGHVGERFPQLKGNGQMQRPGA